MIQKFDYYRQSEKPEFILCNPDDTVLCALVVTDTKCVLRYNDTSELSFQVQEGCTDGYDLIETNREILVDGLGYFLIDSVSEDNTDADGHGVKTVSAKSAQYELAFKMVDYVNGVLPFYDSTHTSEVGSFMEHMLTLMPGWSFVCDSVLESKYRKIEITKQTVLDALYSVASEAYQCIFTFDFLTRTVRADSIQTLTKSGEPVQKTDIYLSFDNVIDGIDMEESSDDIKTKLYVYGQDLDIRQVNPMGTAYMVNLDYYTNTEWMDAETIAAVQKWKNLVADKKAEYARLLTTMRTERAALTKLQAELVDLEGQKAEKDNLVSVKIEAGVMDNDGYISYKDAVAAVNALAAQIKDKKAEITAKTEEIASLAAQLTAINTECLMENVIPAAQMQKIQRFLKEGEYVNDNYVVTDLMSAEEIQDAAEELYAEGEIVLGQLSQPSFTLSVDAKAFIHMPEFLAFTQELELGCSVTVEKNESTFYTPILLEMEFSWDDKEDFSLAFGNRFHLDDAGYTYEELLGTAANTSSSLSANWESIVDFSRNYKSEISNLINNAFDVALHTIISSSNQDMVWDASGLTCRKWNEEAGTYDGEQFKIINNMIAFTDDNWNTLKTIVGKISLDTEQGQNTKYGIVAEAIVGQLLAGENLVIANDSGTFRVDGSGVYFGVQKKDEDGNPSVDEDGNPIIMDLKDYLNGELDKLEAQIGGASDGKISSFYQDTEPHETIPESGAVTVDSAVYKEAITYEGDLWYNTSENLSYRYTKHEKSETEFYFTWDEFGGVPSDIYDKIDGKRTIYTSLPADGFNKDDMWIIEGSGNIVISGVTYSYPAGAEKDDLYIATETCSPYNAEKWKRYSTNLDKENGAGFEFKLNNDGMTLKNGNISMSGSKNGNQFSIEINPTGGFKIQKNTENLFYVDDDGNVVFAGALSGASGTFSGSLSAATGSFSGSLSAATGSFSGDISGATGTFTGELSVGDGKFKVDKNGNLTATNGTFSGDCTWRGQKIGSNYLELNALDIVDGNGNKIFSASGSGIQINSNVSLGNISLSWNDISGKPTDLVYEDDISGFPTQIQNAINVANGASSTANAANTTAINAEISADTANDNVKALANGNYTGTFINGTTIYSPTILSDKFIVTPSSSSGTTGGFVINGYFNGVQRNMFEISYYDSIAAPITSITAYGNVRFNPYTTFTGGVRFGDSTTTKIDVDFSGANVTGLAGTTAVFG